MHLEFYCHQGSASHNYLKYGIIEKSLCIDKEPYSVVVDDNVIIIIIIIIITIIIITTCESLQK